MKEEDIELGCDSLGNCAYYSVERKTFYARNPDGSPMGKDDTYRLLKNLGHSVKRKGDKVYVRPRGI